MNYVQMTTTGLAKPQQRELISAENVDALENANSSIPARVDQRALARPPLVDEKSLIIWPYVIGVVAFHLLIPLAFLPQVFSWWGVLWLPVGNYLFCSMG